MKFVRIASELSLTPQLQPDDLAMVAAAGFRTIINNRPDGEEPGQPSSEELRITAERCGLAYRHIPVVPGQIADDDIAAFEQVLVEMPKPVLAFCRTGNRAASLWALVEAKCTKADDIITAAASAGYDLESLRPRLTAALAAGSADRAS